MLILYFLILVQVLENSRSSGATQYLHILIFLPVRGKKYFSHLFQTFWTSCIFVLLVGSNSVETLRVFKNFFFNVFAYLEKYAPLVSSQ